VRAYPVVERRPWVWIWTGDPDAADESLVPEHPWLDMPGWARIDGSFHLEAHFQLLHENLLDLSHFTYLHPGNIGTPEYTATPAVTTREGHRVRVTRDVKDEPAPDIFAQSMDISGRIRRVSTLDFASPALDIAHLELTDLSRPERVFEAKFLHACTPETEATTHYYWAVARNFAPDSDHVSKVLTRSVIQAFEEDVDAMETIARLQSQLPAGERLEVTVKGDVGALHTRRIIEELKAAEREASAKTLARR
jgi:vanillate O-demethylase monooxygenase subunit